MKNSMQIAFSDVTMAALPVYKPITVSPSGNVKMWTTPVAPIAEPGRAGLIVHVISIGGESERDLADTRQKLHGVFRWLSLQPARITASEMRRDYAQVVEWAETNGRPVFVTNHGRPEAVVLSFALYGRVLKAISRIGLRLNGKPLAGRAEELIEADAKALSTRLRHGEFG